KFKPEKIPKPTDQLEVTEAVQESELVSFTPEGRKVTTKVRRKSRAGSIQPEVELEVTTEEQTFTTTVVQGGEITFVTPSGQRLTTKVKKPKPGQKEEVLEIEQATDQQTFVKTAVYPGHAM